MTLERAKVAARHARGHIDHAETMATGDHFYLRAPLSLTMLTSHVVGAGVLATQIAILCDKSADGTPGLTH